MIKFLLRHQAQIARISLAIIFIWFGALKVFGVSPAEGLVESLFGNTFWKDIVSFDIFVLSFGLFEVLIGVLFLYRRTVRLAFWLFLVHMITTFMPMVMLPDTTWDQFGVLSLIGQYIVKNVALIAAAIAATGSSHR